MKSSSTTTQTSTTELMIPTNYTLFSTALTRSTTVSPTSAVRLNNTYTQASTTELTNATNSTLSSTVFTNSTTWSPTSSVRLTDANTQTSSKTLLIVTSTVASIAGTVCLLLAARGIYALKSRQSCTRITPASMSRYSFYLIYIFVFIILYFTLFIFIFLGLSDTGPNLKYNYMVVS